MISLEMANACVFGIALWLTILLVGTWVHRYNQRVSFRLWPAICYIWLARKRDGIWRVTALLVPRRLCYFVFIRMWAHATTGKYSTTLVHSLAPGDILDRWLEE